jgi:hypothetical protein
MENENVPTSRPGMLTALCILTFIGSGLNLLFSLLLLVLSGTISALLAEIPGFGEAMTELPVWKLILLVLLAAASLYGAITMWKLKKMGFYIYAGAQVVMLALSFGILGLIFTALFIVLYYLNVKHMS